MADDGNRVVIVGGGFGGLAVARELGRKNIPVTVIDRRNYHLFQPLLYQVATAALSPGDIASPIRRILRKYSSVEVIMDSVESIDPVARQVRLGRRAIRYNRLILATGATHSYFGHDEWQQFAPGLKTLEDATALRARLLTAFEVAEASTDPAEREELMTFVVVGGGPTGVEMAGAIAELSRYTLPREFRHIDPGQARVVLVEAGDRLLSGFHHDLADYATRKLADLGVEVRFGAPVEDVGPHAVVINSEKLAAATTIWAAGVKASGLAKNLGVETDRAGRLPVNADMSLPGHPEIFVLGDLARFETEDGEVLPGLAQVAKQQGHHLGKGLAAHLLKGKPLAPFHYRTRGNVAIIGRNAAVYEFGRYKLRGGLAWLLWAIVHVYLLVGAENRVLVCIQWAWRYFTAERSTRLVTTGKMFSTPTDSGDAESR